MPDVTVEHLGRPDKGRAVFGLLLALSALARPALCQTSPPAARDSTGTSVPLHSWTPITAGGYPAEIYGYDKSVYVDSRRIHCIWGGYHQPLSSEPNEATVCYSYDENRWFVLQNNGMWHSDHVASSGHTTGIWAYMPDRDAIAGMMDGSGSNSAERFLGHWWLVDIGGLSGQDKEFSARPWMGPTTPDTAMAYDSEHRKLVLFPNASGAVEICDPDTNSCASPHTSGPTPRVFGNVSLTYNSGDHKIYLYGGGQPNTFSFNTANNNWTRLNTTCSGAECEGNSPPARRAAGFAYSGADKVFLMAGGITGFGGRAFRDTWILDPATLTWKEEMSASKYAIDPANPTFDRLTYDAASNVFLLMSAGGGNTYAGGAYNAYTVRIWAYAVSPALNYGRVTKTYTPPAGSLNRVPPTAKSQSWAFDPAIASAGNTIYAGWIETGAPFDTSNCGTHHPYIQSGNGAAAWNHLPSGAQEPDCTALDAEPPGNPGGTDDSKLRLAVVNGTLWEAHEKWNLGAITSSAWAKSWNGTAWTGGRVGCFTGPCSANVTQYPAALAAGGGAPTLAVIEENHNAMVTEAYFYVAQWDGTAWKALGRRLNANGVGTRVLGGALASDGTQPAACWSEEVDRSRASVSTPPQVYCSRWNGTNWTRMGRGPLNQAASSWANSPAMTYAAGKFYTAWVERSTAGANKLYVCRWDDAGCTLLGGGTVNVSADTGWAAHPSLATDGASVYVAWEEQAALNQHSLGYVAKWGGSSWSQLGGALNADPVNGSVEGISLAIAQGLPTAIWAELTYGNLRQTYARQWNGGAWEGGKR